MVCIIVHLKLPMQHRKPPHVRTFIAPRGDRCHFRRRGDRWKRVSLHRPISFGSKTQPTSSLRLVTWATGHREWGVNTCRLRGRRGKLCPQHAQLFPSLPICAHSCPSLPFDGLEPFGHMWSFGLTFGQLFLIRSFGRGRCHYAGQYILPSLIEFVLEI